MHYSKNQTTTLCGLSCRDESGKTINSWTNAQFLADCPACKEAIQQSEQRTATPAEVDEQVLDWIVENNLGGE
jgi:hypothetical protein